MQRYYFIFIRTRFTMKFHQNVEYLLYLLLSLFEKSVGDLYMSDFFCNFAPKFIWAIMIEILKYCLPALCVLLATWIVMHKFYKSEAEKRLWELKRLSQKEISPLRMRAYERLALLLERTTPEHMLVELNLGEMTILQVQQHLMRTIRVEYDHNLSQQVYVSDEVWQLILSARDQMVAFVNSMAQQMPPESSALDYAKVLITAYSSNGHTANEQASLALRNEARSLL